MQVEFIHPQPNREALSRLEQVLESGVSRLCVASAFCTQAGVNTLCRYSDHFKNEDSFVVVSCQPPTDLGALSALHNQAPGHVYVHFGAESPVEAKANWPPLMHSKIYFGQRGDDAFLLIGSHNLTASALGGLNQEAGVFISGSINERVFQDALQHLQTLRASAQKWDSRMIPDAGINVVEDDRIIIHVETELPALELGRFVHLRFRDDDLCQVLSIGARVVVYLHKPNSLKVLKPKESDAFAVYLGEMTGANKAEDGIPADWDRAHYFVDQQANVLVLTMQAAGHPFVQQAIVRIDSLGPEFSDVTWFKTKPFVELQREVREEDHRLPESLRGSFGTTNDYISVQVRRVVRLTWKIKLLAEDRKRIDRDRLASLFPETRGEKSPSGKGLGFRKFVARVKYFIRGSSRRS